jgi:pyruvate/2-oxoglutarate dehydrogenase complex dihydrolipoamide acyltransferase (E2) component
MQINMPQIGMTMLGGTILKWFYNEGDMVMEEEPLFEFETEKMTNEVVAPVSGVLHIIAPADEDVDCGKPVAEIKEV